MDAIINNPFRILGLPPSISDKVIEKRVSDLIIYAEMGKKIQYETDFEFLGNVDRSANKIKEAAKKLENKELKLFYSLLYFVIKDESDRKAMQFLEGKDYLSAISLWENSIFNNCPIILRGSKTLINVLDSNSFKDIIKPQYTIKRVYQKTYNNITWPLPELNIISHLDSDKLYNISESFTRINDLDKFNVSCRFKFKSDSALKKKISLSLVFNQVMNHNLIIDSYGNFMFELYDRNSESILISSETFSSTFFKESNNVDIKKYNGLLEVWLNDHKIYSTDNYTKYSAFYFKMSGSQTIQLNILSLEELEHLKNYSLDIKLDTITYPYVINLSLVYLLKAELNEGLFTSLMDYFDLIGNFFKQSYFKNYAKFIVGQNYEINTSSLTEIYVKEFYSEFKNRIDPNVEHSALSFYDSFRRLSDEARDKAMEILIGGRVYVFEETIKNISTQRINKTLDCTVLAENLIKSATSFLHWFSNFSGYQGGLYSNLQDKISQELLECGIAHYNNAPQKNNQIAIEAIDIIKKSSDFSKSHELRDRIVKNLDIISKYHGLKNDAIDFRERDLKEYWNLFSFKRQNPKETNLKGKNDHPEVEKTRSDIKLSRIQPPPVKEKTYKKVLYNKVPSYPSIPDTLFRKIKRKFTPINNIFRKIRPRVLGALFVIAWPICFLLIIGLIDYISSSYKSKHIIISEWKGNHLENGSSPYDNYFGSGIFNYNSECWLLFKNGNSTDAIVCLEDVLSGRTIRNEYIQAGTNYTMSNLPSGVYQVKVFSGNDWNPEKTLNNGLIKGAFDTDLSFSISDNIKDRIVVKTTEDYSGITYTTGEITLYKVSNGNMQQRSINSKDFFK